MSGVPVTDVTLNGALGRGLKGELDFAFVEVLESLLRCAFTPIFTVRKTLRSCISGAHITNSPVEFMVDKKLLDEGTWGARQLKNFFPDLEISDDAARFIVKKSDMSKEPLRFNVPVVIHKLVFKDQSRLLFPEQIAVGPNTFDLTLHIQNPIKTWLEEENTILPSNIDSAPAYEATNAPKTAVSESSSVVVRPKRRVKV